MKNSILYAGFLCLLTITVCVPEYYLIGDFETIATDHKEIAILPFEMIFTGIRPKNVSTEQWEKLEVNESVIFQGSFFKEILHSLESGRRQKSLKVQKLK